MDLFDHPTMITLGAHDLRAMREFYACLGWTELPFSGGEWACFQTGGPLLALFPVDEFMRDVAPARLSPWGKRRDGAFQGLTLAFAVESQEFVDAGMQVAEEAGATILRMPAPAAWGTYSGFFADPEGNVWEIACMSDHPSINGTGG